MHKPVNYQVVDGGKHAIPGHYVLKSRRQVGFHVATYDASRPLVIDPVLSYSTYLGGSGRESGRSIALDSSGNAYVTGSTDSLNFPRTGGTFQPAFGGGTFDVIVTKLDPAASASASLVYSTYLGGTSHDVGSGITVDASGNAYVTGTTISANFPTTVGAFQPTFSGVGDAFVT